MTSKKKKKKKKNKSVLLEKKKKNYKESLAVEYLFSIPEDLGSLASTESKHKRNWSAKR